MAGTRTGGEREDADRWPPAVNALCAGRRELCSPVRYIAHVFSLCCKCHPHNLTLAHDKRSLSRCLSAGDPLAQQQQEEEEEREKVHDRSLQLDFLPEPDTHTYTQKTRSGRHASPKTGAIEREVDHGSCWKKILLCPRRPVRLMFFPRNDERDRQSRSRRGEERERLRDRRSAGRNE